MKILFFLESLRSGGKERRLLELISYIKNTTDFEMHIVLTESDIHYRFVYELGIPITIMNRWFIKKDPSIFFRFMNTCLKFKPDVIHSWAHMTTFYAIPASIILNIPLISSEITDATSAEIRVTYQKLIWSFNRKFIKQIISNSHAGLQAYNVPPSEGLVIHNGVRLERFQNLPPSESIRARHGITTKYVVAMVASFEYNKDFKTFIQLARRIESIRNDVTFLAVGGGTDLNTLINEVKNNGPSSVLFTGRLNNVEELINICDFGYLLTNKLAHAEGIPNSIMEFMALKKPIIATNAGGTKELVTEEVTGYLTDNNELDYLIEKTNFLLNNEMLRVKMGEMGYQTIIDEFSLERMGKSFIKVYSDFRIKNTSN